MKPTNRMASVAIFTGLLLGALTSTASAQSWIQLSPIGGPPAPRDFLRAVYNPVSNRMIVFGGRNICTPLNDTWVLADADGLGTPTWTQLSPSGTLPPARLAHSAVYDQATNRMIVFGGFAAGDCTFTFSSLNDVWVLSSADGLGGTPTWTQLFPSGTPPSQRLKHSAVYDASSNRMIVFAGNPNEGFCFGTVNDVWVLSNANGMGGTPAWTQLSPIGTPPSVRSGHTAVYDPSNNRMTVFAGHNECLPGQNDVWVLANANGLGVLPPAWTQLAPLGTLPAARAFHSAVYDQATNRMTIFAGSGFDDTWVLSHANGLGTPTWTQLVPSGTLPPGRSTHSAVYHAETNRMTIFGGDNRNDTWVLTNANGTVPFAAFTLKVEITLGPPSSFELDASFTLGAGSDGIKPLTEALTLQVGTFSTTIPAGSFTQVNLGRFQFTGVINSVTLEVQIVPLGGNSFQLKAQGNGADLTGTVNPVTVQLTIGDDGGSATVTAQFN